MIWHLFKYMKLLHSTLCSIEERLAGIICKFVEQLHACLEEPEISSRPSRSTQMLAWRKLQKMVSLPWVKSSVLELVSMLPWCKSITSGSTKTWPLRTLFPSLISSRTEKTPRKVHRSIDNGHVDLWVELVCNNQWSSLTTIETLQQPKKNGMMRERKPNKLQLLRRNEICDNKPVVCWMVSNE